MGKPGMTKQGILDLNQHFGSKLKKPRELPPASFLCSHRMGYSEIEGTFHMFEECNEGCGHQRETQGIERRRGSILR